ncbi:MAG TPA: outer membrane beta-barrel protein [Bryobacteraceae bacterium]|nr:outer membrane beta-barrel protein [Bryobacteraceae bacterium]
MSRFCVASTLLAAFSFAAHAQVAEFSVSGGVSRLQNKELVPSTAQAAGLSLDDGWRLAFRIGLNSWSFFGQEFGYAYNRSKLLSDGEDLGGMAIHQGFYNLLAYATPEGTRIRPFVTGGGHFSNFVPPGASATQGQGSTKFGVNYGGGVKARISEKYQVRVDFRQYVTGKPFGGNNGLQGISGSLRQNEISVGFGFVL